MLLILLRRFVRRHLLVALVWPVVFCDDPGLGRVVVAKRSALAFAGLPRGLEVGITHNPFIVELHYLTAKFNDCTCIDFGSLSLGNFIG